MTDTTAMLATSRAATAALFENIENLRRQIVLTNAKRSKIERAAVSTNQAADRVTRWAQALRDNARSMVTVERFTMPNYREPAMSDVSHLLLAVCSDIILEGLTSQLADFYRKFEGITDAERAKRLAAVDQEIFHLELAEEAMIRNAERAGLDIQRRPDADPRAVLATDESLP